MIYLWNTSCLNEMEEAWNNRILIVMEYFNKDKTLKFLKFYAINFNETD